MCAPIYGEAARWNGNGGTDMFNTAQGTRRGFSLIELVIVVVIIGIIGAIAIPRMSRGVENAGDSALTANLSVLRSAIDLYQSEHGGKFPASSTITEQLTQYSDDAGTVSATKSSSHIYGPYLRALPPLPVGSSKGATRISNAAGSNVGWIYNETTGEIRANCDSEKDARGRAYSSY